MPARNFWSQSVKPVLLAALIVLGPIAQSARAAETQTALLAGGCFWCVESDFERVPGVLSVVSGFTGGTLANPTYKQVTGGRTGHFEAVEITFDPAVLGYAQLLHMFLRSIDPTDPGGQFCDRGDSYRTAIFVSDAAQNAAAQAAIAKAVADLDAPVVTQILAAGPFYPADAYHQDFYRQTGIILTRFGPRTKAQAYQLYRDGCGRDATVRALWGDAAPFAGH